MSWRKWLVRFLVFTVLGSCTFAVLLYQRWTDPSAVREEVVKNLATLFPGAAVSLDGARLNILGGIVLNELRLSRRDDPDGVDFLHVPSVVVYHDKEQLGHGKIAFRKVELHRPRLHLQRARDGRWNLMGLLKPGPPDQKRVLPTLVIFQGTLVLDDRQAPPGTPLLEINDVELKVINDPETTVTLVGSGTSEELGAVKLTGTWQRESGAFNLSLGATGIPLTPLLVQRLGAHCTEKPSLPFHLEGKADFQARASYQPTSSQPLNYEVSFRVHAGKVIHPKLPLPLENLETSARCVNGQITIERLTATSGPAQVEVRNASAQLPHPDKDFDGLVIVRHLPLTKELANRLPKDVQKLHGYFDPVGQASIELRVAHQGDRWLRHHYTLRPEELQVCYTGFKYPCDRIVGVLTYDHLKKLTTVDMQGFAGGQPLTVRGTWKDSKEKADVNLEINATGLKVDSKLIAALPSDAMKNANSFHPSGRCDANVSIVHKPGDAKFQNTYKIKFHEMAVKWDGFSYPVEEVSGRLHVYPDHYEFLDFRGTHHGGKIFIKGKTFPQAPGAQSKEARLLLEIGGKNIALDSDLRDSFKKMEGLARAWDTFAPAGRLDFTARIDRVPGHDQDLDIGLDVRGCSVAPTFFKYALHDLCGKIRYHKDQVFLTSFTAHHSHTRLSLENGTVDLYPRGGFYADLRELHGNPVLPDEEFVGALPEAMRGAVQSIKLRDPFAIRVQRLVLTQGSEAGSLPDIYWNGQLWVRDAKLEVGVNVDDVTATMACEGRHNGRQMVGLLGNIEFENAKIFQQPFKKGHMHVAMTAAKPDVLVVDRFYAPIFGGEVSGQGRIEFHASDLSYQLYLRALQIQLDQLGKHNFGPKAQLSGIAGARLYLTGRGSGIASLDGNGDIDIPYTTMTRLYNLPLLLDLIKFLNLRWPDRTLFEEAHAMFAIHGNRVSISRLDLLGNVVSLWGKGDVNLDGTDIQLDFYPSWARVEQMLPPVVRSIPPAISKNLLKIEVRGKVTGNPKDIEFHKKPVPVLVDPILQMRDLVSGKKNGGN